MITRRRFLKSTALVGAGFVLPFGLKRVGNAWAAVPLLSAASHPKFQTPLPRPPKLSPSFEFGDHFSFKNR